MKKITKWIFKSEVDLSKKWWHRFFKVIFAISIMISFVSLSFYVVNSYTRVTHQWRYVQDFSTRLNNPLYENKVFSIKKLYTENEVISEKYSYEMDFDLTGKEYLQPFAPIFLEDTMSFCSNNLDDNIQNIADENNIKFFSAINPSQEQLYTDIDAFTKYLKNNAFSVGCVMLDSYAIDTEDGSSLKLDFIRPVNTSSYKIYEYDNNLSGFVLLSLLSLIFLLFFILCVILIYYKVILYIVYGETKKSI